MENSVTRTIIIVAQTAVIAIIMTIAVMSFRQSGELTRAQNRVTAQNDKRIQSNDLIRYSGAELNGTDVLNIIKEHRNNDTAFIVENTSGTETIYNYTDTELTDKVSNGEFETSIDNAKNPNNSAYINPLGKYLCSVQEDSETRAVIYLKFTEI